MAVAGAQTSVYVSGLNDHGSLCIPLHGCVPSPTRVLVLRSQFVRCVAPSYRDERSQPHVQSLWGAGGTADTCSNVSGGVQPMS